MTDFQHQCDRAFWALLTISQVWASSDHPNRFAWVVWLVFAVIVRWMGRKP